MSLLALMLACNPTVLDTPASDSSFDTSEAADECGDFVSSNDLKFSAVLEALERGLAASPSDTGPSGASVAIIEDGVLVSAGGVGLQAKEGQPRADQAVGADTVFFIASTSKWVTSTAAMALVDEGRLDPNASVVNLLPDYTETNGRQDEITLHHLLTMRSGLANDGGCWLYSESAEDVPDGCAAFTQGPGTVLEELFRPQVLASSPYDGSLGVYNISSGTPGQADWNYSNWGIMLAGRVMEVAAQQPFPEIVQQRVFDPACMEASYSADAMVAEDDYALGGGPASVDGYCPEPELGHDSTQPFYPDELACPARAPNGGVRSSAVDLGRFAEALLADLDGAGRMVSQAGAERMFCPSAGRPGESCLGRVAVPTGMAETYGETYGYTNFLQDQGGHQVYGHGGGRAGFGALFWVVPEAGFAVVMLSNDDGGSVALQDAARFALDCYVDGDC